MKYMNSHRAIKGIETFHNENNQPQGFYRQSMKT